MVRKPKPKPTPTAPEPKGWGKVYAIIGACFAAALAVVTYFATAYKQVDILQGRQKIAGWIEPTPPSISLRDFRANRKGEGKFTVGFVAKKLGTEAVNDCTSDFVFEGFTSTSKMYVSFLAGNDEK